MVRLALERIDYVGDKLGVSRDGARTVIPAPRDVPQDVIDAIRPCLAYPGRARKGFDVLPLPFRY